MISSRLLITWKRVSANSLSRALLALRQIFTLLYLSLQLLLCPPAQSKPSVSALKMPS